FFLIAPPPTPIYTLSLHDALPISFTSPAFPARWRAARRCDISSKRSLRVPRRKPSRPCLAAKFHAFPRTSSIDLPPSSPGKKTRSEEHTSELQSRSDLVCRLLLEK